MFGGGGGGGGGGALLAEQHKKTSLSVGLRAAVVIPVCFVVGVCCGALRVPVCSCIAATEVMSLVTMLAYSEWPKTLNPKPLNFNPKP